MGESSNVLAAIVLMSLVCIVCAPSSVLAGVRVEHIVGAWLFDEGEDNVVADSSGNGHDGEIMGTVSWVDEGKIGSALEFHAGEDMVMVEHSDALSLQMFTIMLWIKAPSAGTGEALIHKQPSSDLRNYILNIRADNWIRASFSSGGVRTDCDGKLDIHDDEWHHVAASYDKKALRVYVDGELDGEVSAPDKELETNEEPFQIGHAGGTGGYRYTGLIDEVAVYNIALSEDELQACMEGLTKALAVTSMDKLTAMWGSIKGE